MRIEDLSFDNTRATLEDERVVDVSHQSFCSYEMFGPGHDEECWCLDFEEQGSAGEFTEEELEHIRLENIEERIITLARIHATFSEGKQTPRSKVVAAEARLLQLKASRPASPRQRVIDARCRGSQATT